MQPRPRSDAMFFFERSRWAARGERGSSEIMTKWWWWCDQYRCHLPQFARGGGSVWNKVSPLSGRWGRGLRCMYIVQLLLLLVEVFGLHCCSIATTATTATQFYKQWGRRVLHASLSGCKRGEECKFCGTFDIATRFIHHGPSYLFMLLADGKKDSLQIAFFVKWQGEETSNLDAIFFFIIFWEILPGLGSTWDNDDAHKSNCVATLLCNDNFDEKMELTLCWRFGRDGRVDDNEVWNIIFVIDNWYSFRNIDLIYQGWRQWSLKHWF